MPTTDVLLTKSIATTIAGAGGGAVYPVGPTSVGGASVDEFDVHKTPINGCWLRVNFPSAPTGTTPTLVVSVQADDNTSFSSVVNHTLGPTLSGVTLGTGYGPMLYQIPYIAERYIRVAFTMTGTDPNYGTVTCFIVPADQLERFQS